MAYNWEKGLVNMGMGVLSGYEGILNAKAKEQLAAKQEAAKLQREKTLARYNSTLKQGQWEKQQKYLATQKQGDAYSGFREGDRQVTMREKAAMSPEQISSLIPESDWQIGLAERKGEAEIGLAKEKARATYETTQELTKETQKKEIDTTLSYMSQQFGWDEKQVDLARDFMIAQGITKPSELQSAIQGVEKGLDADTKSEIIKNARYQAENDVKGMSDYVGTANAMGGNFDDDQGDQARSFIKEKKTSQYYTTDIMEVGSKKKGSILDINKYKREEQLKQVIEDVTSGKISQEELRERKPNLYNMIKDQLPTQPTVMPGATKEKVSPYDEVNIKAEDLRKGSILEQGMNLGLPRR